METEIAQIVAAAAKLAFGEAVKPQISPAAASHGDFASNIAFQLATSLKQAPNALASKLAEHINDPRVAKAAAAGGYLNLTMTDDFWIQKLNQIGPKYGRQNNKKAEKVQIEFISANPTGPLTLGNARGGFTGDVLANVLSWLGCAVTREYYFNDAGTQISKLVHSIKVEAGVGTGEREYSGAYIKELARDLEPYLEKGDDELATHATQMIFERYIEGAIHKMGIKFDEWFNEKHLVNSGQFQAAIKRLDAAGLTYMKDGATWLASSKYGDERDRVLVKSTGDITYLGNDIAYHLNIFEERGFDRAIKLWGADHAGQVPSLKLTLAQLLPDKKLEFIILQWVRLVQDGQEVKMSKRAGTYVTVEELIEEVGADVARFFFLMRSSDSQMDFNLGLAREHSQRNPLWYVMYSYVRANSILDQARDRLLKPGKTMSGLKPTEKALITKMTELPQLLTQISHDYGVHRLTFFAQELAKRFHDFYEGDKIISLSGKEAEEKLYLVQQYRQILEVVFGLMGIKPLQKM